MSNSTTYIDVLSTRKYMMEICTLRTIGKPFYQSSGSSESLRSVNSSLSLPSSMAESISQQTPLSGAQRPERRYLLVIIQVSARVSMISCQAHRSIYSEQKNWFMLGQKKIGWQ